MSEAGEDDLFGDLSSACSSQIRPWGAVNKQKQANSSKRRIRECRGPSIQATYHMALREDTLHVFKIFKERSIFWVHLLTKQFELHSFRLIRTIRCPITGCRANRQFRPLLWDNCKVCTPRTALATLAHHDFRKWFQNWILWFWNSCAEQALEWTDPKDPRTIVAQN